MNHESLNGSAGVLLAAQQFNSDVQLPYRFPLCEATHSQQCEAECLLNYDEAEEAAMVQMTQFAQDAQCGYACDYCSKRQPMAFNEVKECCKGQQSLSATLARSGDKISYVGKRHASRFMSDAYGKGIVRGQAENTNLRCNGRESCVSHAETFRTSQTEGFFGKEYLKVVETLNDQRASVQSASFCEIDARNPRRRRVTIRDVAMLYGQRPKHDDIWHLSPYEFVMYWEPVMCSYPLKADDEHIRENQHHVSLTIEGREKLGQEGTNELIPGKDYQVKEEGGTSWLPFPKSNGTEHFRHTWVLVKRKRPRTPAFFGAPVPRHQPGEQQRAAAIVMTYFHPWTLRHEDADDHVKYAGHLRGANQTWQDALEVWLDGNVLCQ